MFSLLSAPYLLHINVKLNFIIHKQIEANHFYGPRNIGTQWRSTDGQIKMHIYLHICMHVCNKNVQVLSIHGKKLYLHTNVHINVHVFPVYGRNLHIFIYMQIEMHILICIFFTICGAPISPNVTLKVNNVIKLYGCHDPYLTNKEDKRTI